ncbi:RluA family pseudouridine synthase [Clostridium luticellarii]|jgi:23S rRNA pseudouridine1911/1915/1917 synthase|uniref:RluA family pseudouridine synthase n=1 Tax=Clostridium luticellarii TaxID=1691940 RepID=UPI00235345E9|nr:RluA family pseudouridine synthase [Clostridium luticellarii]MCI1943723.1 RluA family pseudouridine synthase [Clostridium luticellarii]MCI1966984.1 RluA family pseudouridine synthase [Clostridium luticellarii]MCI1994351.1 RluA family pseudouridine synthase [Clostridium luticellarii]MCI2038696.1 RluA family pseudouridine synthase [Clostridium luticellarii]
MDVKELLVCSEEEEMRLDLFLCRHFPDKSRNHIQNIIERGQVHVNGKTKKSNYKVKCSDNVVVTLPDPVNASIRAENIPIDVLYEDKDLIVVNKPQGMIVHPAAGIYTGTLVNALLNHCSDLSGINGVMRPGIVHRIDKDTSGVLVVAKNDYAHNKLAAQLKDHSMTREYVALVEQIIKEENGTVNMPLARHPKDKIKMAVVPGGREAVTHYEVIERFKSNTLIKCVLETGRTHQIRVHMAYIGHPVVGDPVYGYKKQRFNLKGQLLHARKLGFIHPVTGKYMEFETEVPDYFKRIIEILRKK